MTVQDVQFSESNLFVKSDGYWFGLGNNHDGQLCKPWSNSESSFVKINIANVKQFSAGNFTSLWLTSNNSVLFCGDNPLDNSKEAYVPTSTNHSISNIRFVSAQNSGALFVTDDLYILGTSPHYELGILSYV